jgi:hypothetical protein
MNRIFALSNKINSWRAIMKKSNFLALVLTGIALIFGFGGCPTETEPVDPSEEGAPELLILQVYGTGTATDGAVSHSFIELYNPTAKDASLAGYSVQYAAEEGTAWEKLDLTGTIKAGSSYLILGKKNNAAARLILSDEADQTWTGREINNQKFKIVLMRSPDLLTVADPFTGGPDGGPVAGYIDMLGAVNGGTTELDAYETAKADVISKQKSARRKNLTDTNNNAADFESIDYRSSGVTDDQAEFYRPKRGAEGSWDPVYEAPPPVTTSVLIFQVYGSGTATDGAVSHNFIELYNTTNAAINLAGYSVQYAEDGTTWEKFDLTGTIPASASFLILGNNNNTGGRLQLNVAGEHTTADQTWTGRIINNQKFKIVLMRSTDLLTVADPFTGGPDGGPVAGYIDMLGAVNGGTTELDAYETAKANVISKQKSARRKNLTDTNNNATDFESVDYRLPSNGGITDEQVPLYRPKNTAYGPWDM